jgi:5'-nucleotidase
MAAAIEGCINSVPSIGFSLLDYSLDANFGSIVKYAKVILETALEKGIPEDTCLNVNFPVNTYQRIKGIKICRQNRGVWKEEFEQRVDPMKRDYFWLTGEFLNLEPEARDTDEWALHHNYISIVPVHIDLTAYRAMDQLRDWTFESG